MSYFFATLTSGSERWTYRNIYQIMASHVDHIEVAPRMWDKTIAATYTKKSTQPMQDTSSIGSVGHGDSANSVKPVFAETSTDTPMSFFTQFKVYLMPAIFVVCLIIVMYILWKYFTKYRNSKCNNKIPTIQSDDIDKLDKNHPMNILSNPNLSKYEYDSDDEDEKKPLASLPNLETIEESNEDAISIEKFNSNHKSDESKDEDSDEDYDNEEENEDEYDDDDKEEDEEDSSSVPDLSKIEQMILNDNAEETFPILEDDDEYSLSIPSFVDAKSKPKVKKSKRVTLS